MRPSSTTQMTDFDPPISKAELEASLAAFDLRWPFPDESWRVGTLDVRPERESYNTARAAVAAGGYAVEIRCTAHGTIGVKPHDGSAGCVCCSGQTPFHPMSDGPGLAANGPL